MKQEKKMICNNCIYFVEETEEIGNYQHEEAVKKQKGFCILEDLFTETKPEQECINGNFLETNSCSEIIF